MIVKFFNRYPTALAKITQKRGSSPSGVRLKEIFAQSRWSITMQIFRQETQDSDPEALVFVFDFFESNEAKPLPRPTGAAA